MYMMMDMGGYPSVSPFRDAFSPTLQVQPDVRDLVDEAVAGDTNDSTRQRLTPLFTAVAQRSHAKIGELLRLGADANVPCVAYPNPVPLHAAAETNDTAAMQMLLDAGGGTDPRLADTGFTPLMVAAHRGCCEAAMLLVERGAALSASTVAGICALSLAVHARHHTLVRLLLMRGADTSSFCPLHAAAENGDSLMVQILLAGGCSASVRRASDGTTAADVAKALRYPVIEAALALHV